MRVPAEPSRASGWVHGDLMPGNLLAEFKGPDGYYYATGKGATSGDYAAIWHTAPPADKVKGLIVNWRGGEPS